jgi:hypothetical protein
MTLRTLLSISFFFICIALHAQIHSLSFATKVDFTTGTGTSNPKAIAAADFDGDGKTDVAVLNKNNSTFSVFRNTGTNSTINSSSMATQLTFATPSGGIEIKADDLDGDGRADVVVSNYSTGNISVFLNTSTPGNITFATRLDYATGSNPSAVSIADLDSDGKKDVIVSHSGSNTFGVFRNTSTVGNVTFAARQDISVLGSASGAREMIVTDLNVDGKPDVAVVFFNGYIGLFQNYCTPGTISFSWQGNLIGVTSHYCISAGDIDNDNKPELAISDYNGSAVLVYKNMSGTGTLMYGTYVSFATGSYPQYNAITDIDNDNKPDLLVANSIGNSISVLKNTATTGVINSSSFATKVDFVTGFNPQNFTLADLNFDGRRELIVPNHNSGTFSVFKNQLIYGLIAHYPMNGNGNDTGTFALNGTVSASGVTPVANRYSIAGSAMQFLGTQSGTISTSNTPVYDISSMQGLSVSLWVRADSIFPVQTNRVVYMFYDGQRTSELLFNHSTRKVSVSNWGGTSSAYSYASSKVLTSSSNWYHLVITIDSIGYASQRIKLYVNDSLDLSQSVTMSKPLSSSFYISKHQSSLAWCYNGGIDDIRIYNRVITPAEVHALYLVDITSFRYYSKASGNLNQLATWGMNPDGSGISPLSFDSSNTTYYVTNNTSPQLGGSLKIAGAKTSLLMGDGTTPFNLGINAGDTLSCDSIFLNQNITLTVSGVLSTSRLASATSSTVQYLSAGPQPVAAGNYYNLFASGGLKTLTGNTTIRNTFAMIASVNNPSYNFTLGTDTGTRGTLSRSSGTIYGKFSRWFNAANNTGITGLFPVGTALTYAPLTIEFTAASSTGGLATAEFIPSVPGNNGLPFFDAMGGLVFIDKVAVNGYWKLNSTINSGTFTTSVTANNFLGVNDYTSLRLIKRSTGGSWTIPGSAGTNTGNNASVVVSRSGLSGLTAEYGIGGDQSTNPLPVALISFNALHGKTANQALLTWETAYELNNAFFDIERSTDNKYFIPVAKIKGSGTTAGISTYQYIDDITTLSAGNVPAVFYRLKQVDVNGKYTYTKTASLALREKMQAQFSLYPNPASSTLYINNLEEPAVIYDVFGNRVMTIPENGNTDISDLKSGSYFIRSGTITQKFMKF